VDGGKFLLAGGLMVAGIGGAMSFQHDGPPVVAAGPASNETMVRRMVEPVETARPLPTPTNVDVAARLTGRVEPHTWAGRPAETRPRVAGDYALTSAVEPAPIAPGTSFDERTPRYNRVERAASPWPEAGSVDTADAAVAAPPGLPAESPFRTQNAALTSVEGGESSSVDRTHVVRDGDTLGDLAQRYYGDAGRYRDILEANRDVLNSADLLPIGVQLRIPDAGAAAASPPSAPPAARIVPRPEFYPLGGR
jgi:nucleoid-associated protein YgaU